MDVAALVFQACAFLLTIMLASPNMLAETNLVKRAMFSKLAREFPRHSSSPACVSSSSSTARFYRLVLVYNSYRTCKSGRSPDSGLSQRR